MTGIAQNGTTKNYFDIGKMINFDCIFLGRPAQSKYTAITRILSTLYFTSKVYLAMVEAYPSIKLEIEMMIDQKDDVWNQQKKQSAANMNQ